MQVAAGRLFIGEFATTTAPAGRGHGAETLSVDIRGWNTRLRPAMQLYFFKDPLGNFGDDLNPWLWPRFVPELGTAVARSDFLVGIGTLLNHRLPSTGNLHVMGAGVGYGRPMRQDASCHFHAVRGFKSAQALGLPASAVVTDAAVLLRATGVPDSRLSRERVGVMFTGQSLANWDWARICERVGFSFISCHWSVDKVLEEIQRCDLLLTEAMHGAIVADALRVPWVPITCSEVVLAFKWQDWLSSIDLPYEPIRVAPLYDVDRHLDLRSRIGNEAKRCLSAVRLWSPYGSNAVPPRRSVLAQMDEACRQLVGAAATHGVLSREDRLDSHVRCFLERIDHMRSMLTQQNVDRAATSRAA